MTQLSKKEKREARKAEKLAKLDKRKEQIQPDPEKVPRTAVSTVTDKRPRDDATIHTLTKSEKISKSARRTPHNLEMTWCARVADTEKVWSWREPREWTEEEWIGAIETPLNELEGKTWAEIDTLSSGTGHKMHHYHEVSDLCREARRRWKTLGYEQFDSVFRFRTGGTKRAWGIPLQGHFYLVWYERKHKIYPV